MPVYTDQTGKTLSIDRYPARIISLVPSQTELLADLGLDNEVVGITKFCIHPDNWFRQKTRVGGTKQIRMSTIHDLRPDLIIANKEENVKEQVEELAQYYPVWVSDIHTLDQSVDMIRSVGSITGKEEAANLLADRIVVNFQGLKKNPRHPRTAYLIWKDPYMTVGHDTFIHQILDRAGYHNVFTGKTRYPQISITDLQQAQCELLLLSSEPYPFKQKHINELQQQLPGTTILLVDGEMFSWYGSRLQYVPQYLNALLGEVNS